MRLYALRHEDGTVSVMQMQHWVNHPVEHEISRCAFSSPVLEAIEITEDQAAAIRAARPQPEFQPSVTPVSGAEPAELAELKAQVSQMAAALLTINADQEANAAELADFRQFKAQLAQAIAEKKAQEL